MIDRRETDLEQIRRAASRVERRMRIARALRVLPATFICGLALTAFVLAGNRVAPTLVSGLRARQILAGAAALGAIALLAALLRRLPPRAGAIALDRHHDLRGRLANALALDAIPPAERTPLMEIAIDDACEHARALDPRRAAPIRVPVGLGVAAAAAAGFTSFLSAHPPPPSVAIERAPAERIGAILLTPDDIEIFSQACGELGRRDDDPEWQAMVDRFNGIVEALADGQLDREGAIRRLAELEDDLADHRSPSIVDGLRDRLRDLRDLVLQAGRGEKRTARLIRFGERAHGGPAALGEETPGEADPNEQQPTGPEAGERHDRSVAGRRSNRATIVAASERGFVGSAYERVFTRYRTMAEDRIGRDHIPAGHRSYVKRYFQLIRPRD